MKAVILKKAALNESYVMNVLVYVIIALACYILSYRFYARFIARSLGEKKDRVTPAVAYNDG